MHTIAIDKSPEFSGHGFRGTGIYTKQLIDALHKYETKFVYNIFTRGEKVPNNSDLVHYPYFDPFFLTLPLIKPKPTIVTVHDLIPLAFPDKFPKGIRGAVKWEIQKKSLHDSSWIITDSLSSRRMISEFVSYPINRISVIYLAPREIFMKEISTVEAKLTLQKHSIPNKYIIYVGDVNWNKNIPGVLRAFYKARKDMSDLHLVLVGKSFLQSDLKEMQEINRLIEALEMGSYIHKTGYVTDDELRSLYVSAIGCIQASFAEGFGFPLVEAMACGCPCIVSRTSSLSEIAGPSILVDPYDVESIANGIQRLVRGSLLNIKKASKNWVYQFSWEKVARETAAVYLQVITSNKHK